MGDRDEAFEWLGQPPDDRVPDYAESGQESAARDPAEVREHTGDNNAVHPGSVALIHPPPALSFILVGGSSPSMPV
jgi:hypothetical protein